MKLLVPLIGAFASGLAPGLVAAALPHYRTFPGVDAAAASLFVSVAMYGMVAAAVAGGWLADRFGRVRAIRFAAGCAAVSVPIIGIAPDSFAAVLCGRLLQGWGLGLFSVLLPLYLAETRPAERRGRASAGYQICNSLGSICGGMLGFAVAALALAPRTAWRADVFMLGPVALVLFVLTFFLEEPERLGVDERARCPFSQWRMNLNGLLVAIAALALTSAMGAGVIRNYSVVVFGSVGLLGAWANAADVGLRISGLVAVVLSMAFIDRRGRRFVLRFGTAGACVSLLAMAAVLAVLRAGVLVPGSLSGVIFAVFLVAFIACFSFGPGACAWILAAELLPREIRAKGMGFALVANQLVTAVFSTVFLPVADRLGPSPMFLLFALAAFAYFLLATVALPIVAED